MVVIRALQSPCGDHARRRFETAIACSNLSQSSIIAQRDGYAFIYPEREREWALSLHVFYVPLSLISFYIQIGSKRGFNHFFKVLFWQNPARPDSKLNRARSVSRGAPDVEQDNESTHPPLIHTCTKLSRLNHRRPPKETPKKRREEKKKTGEASHDKLSAFSWR